MKQMLQLKPLPHYHYTTPIVCYCILHFIIFYFATGVGVKGDVLSLRPTQAYRDYLMPGLAVYASPENLVKYKSVENEPKAENIYSSPYVRRVSTHICVGYSYTFMLS